MDEKKKFDITKYFENGRVYLKSLRVENCRILGMWTEWEKQNIVMTKCTFVNVVFDNHCGRGYVKVEGCEFINCEFHGSFGNSQIEVEGSILKECFFKDISLCGVERSFVGRCKFLKCKFLNLDLKWNIGFYELEVSGGKIEHVQIQMIDDASVWKNNISNMQIEHLELLGNFKQNQMESVEFNDVLILGEMRETGNGRENFFIDCDMDGLLFKEGRFDLESLEQITIKY